jgi:hypothetical protein
MTNKKFYSVSCPGRGIKEKDKDSKKSFLLPAREEEANNSLSLLSL